MIVFCCGMSRSGSTVQYQLVSEMASMAGVGQGHGFPRNLERVVEIDEGSPRSWFSIFKSEPCEPWMARLIRDNKAIGIGIFRDIRDVAVSLDRFYSQRSIIRNLGDYHGVDQILDTYLMDAVCWQKAWECLGVPFLDYEYYWPSLVDIAEDCSALLGLRASGDIIIQAKLKYTRAENKKRIAELSKWHEETSMLTKAHIGPNDGEPGVWKKILTPEQVNKIEETYWDWMKEHGYSTGEIR